ncbi:MAG: hypothetical protein K2O59_10705 [Lachnospiraceae bacterium]|nr:hypothetical protein [Lachnospiraceae bacterium]
MRENLLLGNGINLDLGISELCAEAIFQRFQDILIKTSPLYEYLMGKGFDTQICNSIFADCKSSTEKLGIESLARNVYDYLKSSDKWSDNNERELKDFITVSAINAIFYNGNTTIDIAPITNDTNRIKISTLKAYNNIFTINYAEFWDFANKCCFLHGNYELPEVSSAGKDIILFYPYNDDSGTYKRLINQLSDKYSMQKYLPDVIFTPLLDKQHSLYVGHSPSNAFFPGSNTFPSNGRELYVELNNIESLDIFGMSPFGDDRLIQRLSVIPKLTIYVLNKEQKQVEKWNDLLNRECCVDSFSFYNK